MKHRSHAGVWLLAASFVVGCRSTSKEMAPTTAASTAALEEQPLESAKRLFFDAVDGRDGALDEATRLLKSLGGATAADPVVVGYHGSCTLLAASKAVWPWEMGRLAKEGLTLQDQAVAEAPDNLELRALRGLSNFKLPGFFHRETVAADDLSRVATALEADAATRLEPRVAAAALYHHGLVRQKADDPDGAVAAWRKAVSLAPDTPGGRAAAAEVLHNRRFP